MEDGALGKRCEATFVDPGLNVAMPQSLEVNHGGGDITVAHPLLERANVDSILEMPCGIGVTEFMQKPARAVGPVGATIDFNGSVLKFVFHDAMPTIQFGAISDRLEFLQHGAVRPSRRAWKQWVVGSCVLRTKSPKKRDQLLRDGNFAFLPILRVKSPMRFCGDTHGEVFEIYVAPSDETSLRVAEARHQIKLETDFLVRSASPEKCFELRILVDRPHGFNKTRPVSGVQKFFLAVLFENLRYHDELVVHTLPLLSLLRTVGREVEKILSLDLVNVGLGAELLEGPDDEPIGAIGSQ